MKGKRPVVEGFDLRTQEAECVLTMDLMVDPLRSTGLLLGLQHPLLWIMTKLLSLLSMQERPSRPGERPGEAV